ncbi:dUTP diphosphatase [Ureibacillus chungkukjangi]|uniref:dUTP diphosphatase n=1 Tax=Ureibacillus chungkukjangi TaxID=1202712 RepID=UPI0038510D8A
MDLIKLFEAQRTLDAHIESEHPTLPNENRLNKRILALLVELGELANEWRGFKFWSNDQKPRIQVITNNPDKTDKNKPWVIRNLVLEEYVDCLHFLLSIGNMLNIKKVLPSALPDEEVLDLFNYLFHHIHLLRDVECQGIHFYSMVFREFVMLGEKLGFSWEEVEQAYFEKNKTNHERQNTGY